MKNSTQTQLVMVLGYESWNFDEAVVADLIVDGKTIYKKFKWEGDGKILIGTFDDTDALIPS